MSALPRCLPPHPKRQRRVRSCVCASAPNPHWRKGGEFACIASMPVVRGTELGSDDMAHCSSVWCPTLPHNLAEAPEALHGSPTRCQGHISRRLCTPRTWKVGGANTATARATREVERGRTIGHAALAKFCLALHLHLCGAQPPAFRPVMDRREIAVTSRSRAREGRRSGVRPVVSCGQPECCKRIEGGSFHPGVLPPMQPNAQPAYTVCRSHLA
jgi:hypothetical protein